MVTGAWQYCLEHQLGFTQTCRCEHSSAQRQHANVDRVKAEGRGLWFLFDHCAVGLALAEHDQQGGREGGRQGGRQADRKTGRQGGREGGRGGGRDVRREVDREVGREGERE